jgi:7-cyano-7-deazaguanine synthase in queuosine biosynthesis
VNSQQSKQAKNCLTLLVVEHGSQPKHESQRDTIIAEIGKEIIFDPSILGTYHYDGWKPVHHDLLVVCAAVELADRRCPHCGKQWARTFHITVPVQELKIWEQQEVKTSLRETLRLLTGDNWYFSFVQAERSTEDEARQRSLSFGCSKQFAIAYSEGLDSRCVSGIYDVDNIAVRVRVSKRDRIKQGERPFDLIPFEVRLKSSPESSVRSRGFKFAAITAIAGHLAGVRKIIVPESGQGALGPVLIPLHNIYADYRNYPTFFRKMERFLKELLGYTVVFEQPRLWYTKGQTITVFLEQSGRTTESLLNTRSCWQRRMNVRVDGKLRQCGLCAACLLRRMSMHAARVDEPSNTYTFADLSADHYNDAIQRENRGWQSEMMIQYGSVGARHLQQLADLAGQSDTALRAHIFEIARATGLSEEATRENLRMLLAQHAVEWGNFVSAQGKSSFLYGWTKGGRYGRFE